MSLVPPPPLTPAQMLADAQYKLHLLATGKLSVEVVVDGRTVRYNRANLEELKSYIADLNDQIAGTAPVYGAIGFIF